MKHLLTFVLLCALCLSGLMLAYGADLYITWTPRDEADLAGYRLYYGTAQGQYGPPISTVKTSHILQVEGGQDYYISITAIDVLGQEGRKSNYVKVSAPPDPPPPPPALPAPMWVAPPPRAVLVPGKHLFEWTPMSGAVAYMLFIHQMGTPYPDEDSLACAQMIWCGKIAGSQLEVDLDPNSQYDMWISSVDPAGVVGPSNGNFVTVGDVPPPPPPKVLLREALDRAIDACVADAKRTLLKCFKLLQTELDKVTP